MYTNVNGEAVDAGKVAVDLEDKNGEVAERPVYCPSAFNKVYYYFDAILDMVLWKDESLSTSDRPIFSKAERYNIFFYILGIMCYKVRGSLFCTLPLPAHLTTGTLVSLTPHTVTYGSSASSSTMEPSRPWLWTASPPGTIPSTRIRATWTASTRLLSASAPSSSGPS